MITNAHRGSILDSCEFETKGIHIQFKTNIRGPTIGDLWNCSGRWRFEVKREIFGWDSDSNSDRVNMEIQETPSYLSGCLGYMHLCHLPLNNYCNDKRLVSPSCTENSPTKWIWRKQGLMCVEPLCRDGKRRTFFSGNSITYYLRSKKIVRSAKQILTKNALLSNKIQLFPL